MPAPLVHVDLFGAAIVQLDGETARPRFLQTVVAALVMTADPDGVVLDARRQIAEAVDGGVRWPERHTHRKERLAAEVPRQLGEIRKLRERAQAGGRFSFERYSDLGGVDAERKLYLTRLPPVHANISRCLSMLVTKGLVERWYQNLESGDTGAKPFRGAVVCVRLGDDLRRLVR